MTLLHHDGEKLTTRRVLSLENLKEFLGQYNTVPMDDPQVEQRNPYSKQFD